MIEGYHAHEEGENISPAEVLRNISERYNQIVSEIPKPSDHEYGSKKWEDLDDQRRVVVDAALKQLQLMIEENDPESLETVSGLISNEAREFEHLSNKDATADPEERRIEFGQMVLKNLFSHPLFEQNPIQAYKDLRDYYFEGKHRGELEQLDWSK